MATVAQPKTLQQAVEFFADEDRCHAYVVAQRFPNGLACPTCGSVEVRSFTATVKPRKGRKSQKTRTRRLFECTSQHAKRQFTLKTGTVMEDSPLPLKSWLLAMWMVANCKNGVSSYEVARTLGIAQKNAWHMLHRIRLAMQARDGGKLDGGVEIDETFIGAKARNMHKGKKAAVLQGRKGGLMGKIAVIGMLQRHPEKGKSRVRLQVVPRVKRTDLVPHIKANVAEGANVFTDSLRSYDKLWQDYIHNVIDHAERYADGQVHTNGMENFWSLLKRTLNGTYVSVEPFHLFRYLDEQAMRFNMRENNDADRFAHVLRSVVGKRLTFAELTAKEATA
jgi:transposase-like protein